MKRIIMLLMVVAGVAGAYYAMHRPPGPMTLTGIVTTQDVIVAPELSGRIGQLLVKEGDTVEKNQLIAVLRTDELEADRTYYARQVDSIQSQVGENEAELRYEQRQTEDLIHQARAEFETAMAKTGEARAGVEDARVEFERMQKLSREGIAAVQQLDQARVGFDAAKARLDATEKQVEVQRAAIAVANANAERVAVQQNRIKTTQRQREAAAAQRQRADVRLSYSEVRAPAGGVVDVRAAREGEVVASGQPIVTLIDPDDLWVRADIEETYIDRIRLGDQLKVRLPSGDTRLGTVYFRAVDASFATQRDVSRTKRDIKTFEIRLRLDNQDRRLAVGMTTYIELPL